MTKQTHRFWRGFLSQAITWFATDRNVQRRKSGTPTERVIWLKRFTLQLRYNKLSSNSMLKIFQATIRKSFLVPQSFLIDVNFFKWEAPVAGILVTC